MNLFASLTLVFTLLLSGCTNSLQDKATTKKSATSTKVYNYECKSSESIFVTYPTTNSATVHYKGRSYDMKITVSGSGARYVGGGLEWWIKGSEGTLLQHMPDGTSGDIVELCEEL